MHIAIIHPNTVFWTRLRVSCVCRDCDSVSPYQLCSGCVVFVAFSSWTCWESSRTWANTFHQTRGQHVRPFALRTLAHEQLHAALGRSSDVAIAGWRQKSERENMNTLCCRTALWSGDKIPHHTRGVGCLYFLCSRLLSLLRPMLCCCTVDTDSSFGLLVLYLSKVIKSLVEFVVGSRHFGQNQYSS